MMRDNVSKDVDGRNNAGRASRIAKLLALFSGYTLITLVDSILAQYASPRGVLNGFFFYLVGMSVAAGCLALFARRIGSLFRRKALLVASGAILSCCSLLASLPVPNAILLLVLSLASICSMLLNIAYLECFTFLPPQTACWGFVVVVAQTALYWLAQALADAPSASMATLFSLLSSVILIASARLLQYSRPAGRSRRKMFRSPGILAGIFLISVGSGYFNYLFMSAPMASAHEIVQIVSNGVVAALIAAVGTLHRTRSHLLDFRIIATCMLLAVLTYAFAPSFIAVSSTLIYIGFIYLTYRTLFIAISLCHTSTTPCLRILGSAQLILLSGQLVFVVSGEPLVQRLLGSAFTMLAVSSLLVLAFIWLFNERRLNAFFWGVEDGSTGDFVSKARALAGSASLSQREEEVMLLFAQGRTSSYIAETMSLSESTVKTHLSHIYKKCDVHSRQGLISRIEEVAI